MSVSVKRLHSFLISFEHSISNCQVILWILLSDNIYNLTHNQIRYLVDYIVALSCWVGVGYPSDPRSLHDRSGL